MAILELNVSARPSGPPLKQFDPPVELGQVHKDIIAIKQAFYDMMELIKTDPDFYYTFHDNFPD